MQVGQSLFGAVDRRLDDVFTRRREVVTRLTQVTHGAPIAATAACAVAAMGSYALEGCSAADLIAVALDEFREVARQDEAAAVWKTKSACRRRRDMAAHFGRRCTRRDGVASRHDGPRKTASGLARTRWADPGGGPGRNHERGRQSRPLGPTGRGLVCLSAQQDVPVLRDDHGPTGDARDRERIRCPGRLRHAPVRLCQAPANLTPISRCAGDPWPPGAFGPYGPRLKQPPSHPAGPPRSRV